MEFQEKKLYVFKKKKEKKLYIFLLFIFYFFTLFFPFHFFLLQFMHYTQKPSLSLSHTHTHTHTHPNSHGFAISFLKLKPFCLKTPQSQIQIKQKIHFQPHLFLSNQPIPNLLFFSKNRRGKSCLKREKGFFNYSLRHHNRPIITL